MSISHQSSVQSFGSVTHGSIQSKTRPYSALQLQSGHDTNLTKTTSPAHRHYSLQGLPSLLHKDSYASIMTNSTAATNFTFTPGKTNKTFRISQIDLHRQVIDRNAIKAQAQRPRQIKMPLFPTERTRGSTTIQNDIKPVDITQVDLLPIDVSRGIILSCIDEIRLRGLKHKHLFRIPFYSPSVEAALSVMLNSKRKCLFSVKMMRMDTVGGLLTTVISRTFPPIIPQELQSLFQNPNGHFCFELLAMLPELNRFLFVEILNLCCDLGDNQLYNLVSCSKLSVYPGSCCFGLDEYMPTWDTRYLLTSGVTKKSEAFYQIICGYREERELSAEELKQKQVRRDRILQDERLEILERLYGLEGTHNILRRESRIAQGLPPDSPELPPLPDHMKEVSLYSDRREIVVADDAISVLDIQLDQEEEPTPAKASVKRHKIEYSSSTVIDKENKGDKGDEENVENIIADLRKSVSMAIIEARATTTLSAIISYKSPYRTLPQSRRAAQRPKLTRAKSVARSSSINQNVYPVSPGDIFGISRHAIEQRELQGFLSVARTNKKKYRSISKRNKQRRIQSRLLQKSNFGSNIIPRARNFNSSQRPSQMNVLHSKSSLVRPRNLRREKTRQLRKDIEVYQSQGLSVEEAMEQRKVDLKKKKRREKRAKAAALTQAEAAAKAELERENARILQDVTMEEAEILEAFDYLTDSEFEEFLSLAGITMQDVEKIREKAAVAALKQVTEDIQSVDRVKQTVATQPAQKSELVVPSTKVSRMMEPEITPVITSFGDAFNHKSDSTKAGQKSRPTSITHMTSMDLLIKNTNLIGDSSLRCYPIIPSAPSVIEKTIQQIVVPESIVAKDTTNEVLEVTIQFTVKEETKDEQKVIRVPTPENYTEPSRERTSEDSTLSTAETVVSLTESIKDTIQHPEPAKEIQPTVELDKEKQQTRASAMVQKVISQTPEKKIQKELPQISAKVQKELPQTQVKVQEVSPKPVANSKLPQIQTKIQKSEINSQKDKLQKELPEPKPATKSVMQNVKMFEQTVQPKKDQNTRVNSVRARANMFNTQSKTSAPTSAPTPGRLRNPFLTPASELAPKATPSPSQSKVQTALSKESNSPQVQKSKLPITKTKEPSPSSKTDSSTSAHPAATQSKQATSTQIKTPTPISKLPAPTAVLISKIPSAPAPAQQPSTNSTSVSGTSRIPVSNRGQTNSPTNSRPASPGSKQNMKTNSVSSLPKPSQKTPSTSVRTPTPDSIKVESQIESSVPKRVMEITSVYSSQSDNDSSATLQMLDIESGDEDEKVISLQIKSNNKTKVFDDEEAAELRELLDSMTQEERLEYFRLSQDSLVSSMASSYKVK